MPKIAMHVNQSQDRNGDENALARGRPRKKYAATATNGVMAT
jgi:hypothetical protein